MFLRPVSSHRKPDRCWAQGLPQNSRGLRTSYPIRPLRSSTISEGSISSYSVHCLHSVCRGESPGWHIPILQDCLQPDSRISASPIFVVFKPKLRPPWAIPMACLGSQAKETVMGLTSISASDQDWWEGHDMKGRGILLWPCA